MLGMRWGVSSVFQPNLITSPPLSTTRTCVGGGGGGGGEWDVRLRSALLAPDFAVAVGVFFFLVAAVLARLRFFGAAFFAAAAAAGSLAEDDGAGSGWVVEAASSLGALLGFGAVIVAIFLFVRGARCVIVWCSSHPQKKRAKSQAFFRRPSTGELARDDWREK